MAKKKSGLRAALSPESSLVERVAHGLQAVLRVDRERMTIEPPRYVVDSLALDARHGSTGEWDYLLGVDERQRPLLGVEVHPASNGEVASILSKHRRTLAALQNHMSPADVRWIWIASGSDTVARGSREFRQLVKAGIDLVGRHLSLPRRT